MVVSFSLRLVTSYRLGKVYSTVDLNWSHRVIMRNNCGIGKQFDTNNSIISPEIHDLICRAVRIAMLKDNLSLLKAVTAKKV